MKKNRKEVSIKEHTQISFKSFHYNRKTEKRVIDTADAVKEKRNFWKWLPLIGHLCAFFKLFFGGNDPP